MIFPLQYDLSCNMSMIKINADNDIYDVILNMEENHEIEYQSTK